MTDSHDSPKSLISRIIDNRMFTFVGALLSILLCAFIIYFVYLPLRATPIDDQISLDRQKTLSSVVGMQHMVTTSYYWMEKPAGIVLIPVSRAMDLVVDEYNDPVKRKLREDALKAQPGSASHDDEKSTQAKPASSTTAPATTGAMPGMDMGKPVATPAATTAPATNTSSVTPPAQATTPASTTVEAAAPKEHPITPPVASKPSA